MREEEVRGISVALRLDRSHVPTPRFADAHRAPAPHDPARSGSAGVTARRPSIWRREVLAPAGVLFSIMTAHALLETARDALFLARLGAERLAWAYLAIAAAALIAVTAVRRWAGLVDPRRILIAFLIGAVLGTSALAALVPLAPWAVFALYVWTGLVATLVVPCFWTLLDRSLRVATAKRTFAAIGAGGVLGAMVGSALAAGLGRAVAPGHLVTAGAIAFGLATIAAIALAPRPRTAEAPTAAPREAATSTRRARRFVQLLLAVSAISTVTLTLGDLTFKRVLAERLPASELATAFGQIYAVLNVVGLAIQLAIAPRLLAKLGVGGALMILPLIVVGGALGFAATGATAAVLVLKLGDGGLRHSLHRVGSEILYLPVPDAIRDGAKPIADALGQRGGQALAALLVFAAASLGGARTLAAATVAVGAVWLVALLFARRAYVAQFREMLRACEVRRDVRLPDLDRDALDLLGESLACPDEIEALAALELLARRGGRIPALVLYHPRQRVVRRALELLEGELRPDASRILAHLIDHPDPEIRADALAASSRSGCHRDRLVAALEDPHPAVRAAALIGLVDDEQHRAAVLAGVEAMASGLAAEQAALAHAIGHAADARFRAVLEALLARRDPAVVRAVLGVYMRSPELANLDRLVALLRDAHVRADVRRVLLAAGARGLAQAIEALDDPRTPIVVRQHLPRTISRFGSRTAAAALVARLLHEPDGTTEFKILRALGRLRADDPKLPIDTAAVRTYARREVADAARFAMLEEHFEAAAELGPGASLSSSRLLAELLAEKRQHAIEHAFRALGILYPGAELRGVHDAIVSEDEVRRSAAREIIDDLLPQELRVPLLAVIDDLPPEERVARLGSLAPAPFASSDDLLAALLADRSASLRCLAAHHVAERRLIALRPALVRLRSLDVSPHVLHAFDQAIARLDV
jgi:AAA family ATP:ADP antiporter